MENKLKLMTIVGTRPEIIRLSEIIKKCDEYFDHILVHTGQNYDYSLNEVFFDDLNIKKPSFYLEVNSDSLGNTIGNIIAKSYNLLNELKPDALLVLGDTNSCLSTIAAKRLHIPIFHLEAGNRCFDECLPEETNRRIVDHTADVNLCYTENARRYLLMEGRPKDRTFVVGSPMREVLDKNIDKIKSSNIVNELELENKNYFLLSAHREENIDNEDNFYSLFDAINEIAKNYNTKVLYSMHPRAKKFIEQRNYKFDDRIIKHIPLSFSDYNCLQFNAKCIISDSGTLPEESDYYSSVGLNFPAVSLRTSTERPEAIENGRFILSGIDKNSILQAIDLALNLNNDKVYGAEVRDYSYNNVSDKVVKLIQSFTPYINRYIWRKNLG